MFWKKVTKLTQENSRKKLVNILKGKSKRRHNMTLSQKSIHPRNR